MTAPPGVNLAQRRWIGRLIRLGLVVATLAIVATWWVVKRGGNSDGVRIERRGIGVQREAPAPDALGPGDARILTQDGAVNLILQGDRILAGLSPQTVQKIRADLERSVKSDDTTGLGGMIAQTVKSTVAQNIGTHVVYPLSEIRDIRLEGDEIVIERMNGERGRLLGSVKVNNKPVSESFDRAEAERFIEQVRARLGQRR